MSSQKTPNVLGTEKIGKLLWQYSIPAIVATTVSSLYNVIDRIFIGHGVGPLAISGLALTFPFMNLSAAFGSLVGVGSSAMVSIKLGEKDRDGATHILGNAFILNIAVGILFSTIMLCFIDQILYMFGASKDTLPYARDFMHVILLGNVFTHLYIGMNHIIRASGYPKKSMIITLLTVGLNLILAPLFIFHFNLGIKGAALATVCAQLSGTVWGLVHLSKKSSYVHFVKGYFKPKLKIILDIFSIGMSTFIMFTCTTLIVVLVNVSLAKYGGDYAIGAFGIIASFETLFAMVVLGFVQGMQPIVGYNYGARQFPRAKKALGYTIVAGVCVTTFGFLLSEFFPRLLASAFTNNETLLDITSTGMRLTLAMFPVVGFQMVTSNFFQSIGHARVSILLSLSRQVILLIPALLILPHFFSLQGVWIATPTADLLAAVITFFVLKRQLKRISD
jgi:putative MATE family efflux protein